MTKLNVALVGLGFGSCFIEIYQRHPDVAELVLCDSNSERLAKYQKQFGVKRAIATLEEILLDPNIDAVHLNSGIPDHARHSLAVLNSGKHCACTVPMATSVEDIRAVLAARRSSGRNYMMMETQIYAREFLYACELRDQGVFGRLQMLRGAHYQDMERWPPYWRGLPPMWYATHAIAPCLAFARGRARSVRCLGSGTMREELKLQYRNPFPSETAIFALDRPEPLAMEITRSLFHFFRGYLESFSIYGESASLEAGQMHGESPVIFASNVGTPSGPHKRLYVPDYASLLPEEIKRFTGAVKLDARGEHPSVMHGGDHGGSHPHLVHEFVRSIVEHRSPAIDEFKAANWTAPGICAHESALRSGAEVLIPTFE
jgi:predicted dehydrogenase